MMPVQMKDSRDVGAVGQGQYDGAAGPGVKGRRSRVHETRRRYPIGLRATERPRPKRQIDPRCVFQVEVRRQAIGWQWRSCRQRRIPDRGHIGGHQPGDRTSPLAVMQEEGRVEPGGAVASTKASTRVPGASTSVPLRAKKGFARLAVQGHDANLIFFYFYSNNIALKAIYKASLNRSLVRTGTSSAVRPLTV